MSEPFFLGATGAGDPMMLDLERLIGSHAGIVANSGGGKSGLIRRLLEATHGRVQHIVLDPEDEFYTLRERYEYVIAGGDGGDAPATIANAPDLALGALTHGFSLVVQLNDLGVDRGAEFIGAFLTALVNAPRNLWHPVLVTIDEAQRFVPRLGSTDATEGVKELIYRGRKRGFTALLAGTKFTEIDPAVRGGINNWMLGRVGQAVDRNTMAEQLGFTAKEGRERLRGMEPRHFWAFGPALSREPVLFRVADVATTPVHAGQAKVPTPPPPEALRDILAGIATATAEQQEEATPAEIATGIPDRSLPLLAAKTSEILDLKEQVARLEEENKDLRSELMIARAKVERVSIAADALSDMAADLRSIASGTKAQAPEADSQPAGRSEEVHSLTPSAGGEEEVAPPRPSRKAVAPSSDPIRGRKALAALVARNTGLTERQWAWIAGFSVKGGTWGTYKGSLRGAGLVEEIEGKWWPTEAGLREDVDGFGPFPALGPELARYWGGKISGVRRMVDVLVDCWPEWTLRANLADRLNMAAEGGTFGTYLSRLRSAGLIEQQGKKLRLHPELMGAKG